MVGTKYARLRTIYRTILLTAPYTRYLHDAHTVDTFNPIRFSSESRHVVHDGTFCSSTRLFTLTAVKRST